MTTTSPPAAVANDGRMVRPAAHQRSGSWFLRRAVIGIVLLSVFAFGGALLLDASIKPDQAGTADSEE